MAQGQGEAGVAPQAAQARSKVVEVGQLMSDITAGRDVDAVHDRLLELFDAAEHDGRIDGMELGRREFTEVWAALQNGLALPPTAWEQVVLPTVVAFSNKQNEKVHLELATTYWLAARAAVDAIPDYPNVIAALVNAAPATTGQAAPAEPSAQAAGPARNPVVFRYATPAAASAESGRSRNSRRTMVAVAVAVLATVIVMLLLFYRQSDGSPASMNGALPSPRMSAGMVTGEDGSPIPLPTAPPTGSPEPSPMITDLPLPTPSWQPPPSPTMPGGKPPSPPPLVAPSAPLHLTAKAAGERNVWLSWSAPIDGGSGGVAVYRIFRNGQPVGHTEGATSVNVQGLTPGTTYTFEVYARNAAGLQSPASNRITVVTASPPPPSPTKPEAPSPEPPAPSPPAPSPSESPSEPAPPTSEPPTATPDATMAPTEQPTEPLGTA
jgi:hypothetical protein